MPRSLLRGCLLSCLTSMPAIVPPAAQNDVKPSIGGVIRFTDLWDSGAKFTNSTIY